MYDVAILGCGPAGLTASIYASRYGLNPIVLYSKFGGMTVEAYIVENYPGFESINGLDLIKKIFNHAKKFGGKFIEEEIKEVKKEKGFFILRSEKNTYKAKSLIIATGTEKRKLGIKNEEKFIGKGLSYCFSCDAPFYKGKIVGVIGGSSSAAKAAIYLSDIAKKVYLIYRREKLRAEPILIEKIGKKKNIEVLYNTIVEKLEGKEFLEYVVTNKGKLVLDGIFVEIGGVPSNAIALQLGVKLDENGFIIVDREMRTNVEGVFAAGDITNSTLKQIITAAAQGAVAAFTAYNFLKKI